MKRTFESLDELRRFILERPPALWHLLVLHDDDKGCTPSVCRCSPLYELREGTVENFVDGAARSREWFRRVAS